MYLLLLLLCGMEALYDMKTKTIRPCIWFVVSVVCVIWNMTQNEKDWLWICMGTFVGLFLILCSRILKGGIGIGDGIVFGALGLGLGMKEVSNILFYSLLVCCIWSIVQLLRKKCSRTDEVPFLPFVFIGMLWNLFVR